MRLILIDPDRDGPRDLVRKLAFHPQGHSLAAVVGEPDHFRDLCRYDLAADRPTAWAEFDPSEAEAVIEESGPDPVASRDLELVALGMLGFDGVPAVQVVDTWASEQTSLEFASPTETTRFLAFAFAADNASFYACTSDPDRHGPLVREWDLETLFENPRLEPAEAEFSPYTRPQGWRGEQLPVALATDPAGRWFAVGTDKGEIWLFDPQRERHPRKIADGRGAIRTLAFGAGGKSVVALTAQGVAVYETETGEVRQAFDGAFTCVDLAGDGARVALGRPGGTWAVHDSATGGEIAHYNSAHGPVSAVAFAPDGLTCAVGGDRGRVVLWDV